MRKKYFLLFAFTFLLSVESFSQSLPNFCTVYTTHSEPTNDMVLNISSRESDCTGYDFSFSASGYHGNYASLNSYYIIKISDSNNATIDELRVESMDYTHTSSTLNGNLRYYYDPENIDLSDYNGNIEDLKAKVHRYTLNECVSYGTELATFMNIKPSMHTSTLPPCSTENDRDNDGVPNTSDNCPDNANPDQADSDGDGIGDVCDSTDNNAKPDLTSKKQDIFINSACTSCATQLSNLGSARHILNRIGSMTIDAYIQNIGNASASSFKVNYYLSIDSNLNDGDFKFPNSVNISSLSQNTEKFTSITLSGFDVNSALPFQNYTLIIKIDGDDQVTESTESNNIFKIPVKYQYSSNKIGPGPIDDGFKSTISDKNYQVNIYDFYGRLIKKANVKSKSGEIKVMKELGLKGLYIIKTNNESRKVYLD